jgi:hypothetical protein
LWRHAIAELERQGTVSQARLDVDEPALADVLAARWPADASVPSRAASKTPAAATAAIPAPARSSSPLGRIARLFGGSAREPARTGPTEDATAERERRERILADRAERLAGAERPRVIVLTNPGTHQRIGASDSTPHDPLFGAVIPALDDRGYQPVLLATGIDQRRDEDWALVADHDRLLPQFLLRTRWSRPEDDERAATALEIVAKAIDAAASSPVDLDGLVLTRPFIEALSAAAAQIVRTDVLMLARIERFIAEVRPSAILLAQEGIRTPWLMAARSADIPLLAVQHGVLYAGHAGYPNRRHPALCLATTTCVYGEFERDVLLDLAYETDEVVVTGSPRLDLDIVPSATAAVAERDVVRRELGVAAGDRLLLVSTVNLRFLQRSHFAHMLEALLGAPLPGVHVVFKQHPGERDEGPYRKLLLGLATASGYPAPAISVVKDIDLYRLLRAADAHLGLLSTVLTEAVVTGTPNLIAMTDAHSDLLGYVGSGVARPVRTALDVLHALDRPEPLEPARRQAFLERHFLPGDATDRLVTALTSSISETPIASAKP